MLTIAESTSQDQGSRYRPLPNRLSPENPEAIRTRLTGRRRALHNQCMSVKAVRDLVAAVTADAIVQTGTPVHLIGAVPTVKIITVGATKQHISTSATEQLITPFATLQRVATPTTVQDVSPAAAAQQILAVATR